MGSHREGFALLRGLDQRDSPRDRALPIFSQAWIVERPLVGVFVDDESRVARGYALRRLTCRGRDLNLAVGKDQRSTRNFALALLAFELDSFGNHREAARGSQLLDLVPGDVHVASRVTVKGHRGSGGSY